MQPQQRSVLQDLFKIQPSEVQKTAYSFVYLFTAIGSFTVARTTRYALFLEIPNYKAELPKAYILVALTVSAVMYSYSKVEGKLRRDRTNAITVRVLIGVTLLFRVAFLSSSHIVYWLFYIWVELFGAFLVVQFWTFINEIFHSRQAKRLFALISGGGLLSNIPFGYGIRASVPIIGTENLLFVIAGCLVISLWMIKKLGIAARHEITQAHLRRPTKHTHGGQEPQSHQSRKIFETKHLRLIAAAIVLTYWVSTLVDYQFSVIVGDSIAEKDARSAYIATLFLVTGIVGTIIQFTITARLLERFGVLPALLLLPICMFLGSTTLLLVPLFLPGLWAAGFTIGSEKVLRYTVNDSTLQLMYLPVPSHMRGKAKAFIDGVLKQTSIGAAGILLFLLFGQTQKYLGFEFSTNLSVYDLSWIVGVSLICWIVIIFNLRREYLLSLVQTLQKRRLNFDNSILKITDEATVNTLIQCLTSKNLRDVMHALELLPAVSEKMLGPVTENVVRLLSHESEEVRVIALEFLESSDSTHAENVAGCLKDPSPQVRAAAISAYCGILREEAIVKTLTKLDDPHTKVRATAIAALIRYGGLDGILACASHLKELLTSDVDKNREHAAWILGEIGVQNFYQPLATLLGDPCENVQLAAVKASGSLTNPKLLPSLLNLLDRPRLSGAVIRAIATYGTQIEPTIEKILRNKTLPSSQRANGCRVLARLKTETSAEILVQQLVDDSIHVRIASVQALQSILKQNPAIVLDFDTVAQSLRSESKNWLKLLGFIHDLGDLPSTELLCDAIVHRQNMAKSLILGLLALKYQASTIDLVAGNLNSQLIATRANAVEVLDNLLDKEEKKVVIPILEDQPIHQKLEVAQEEFGLRSRSADDILTELIRGPDSWLNACSSLAVGQNKIVVLQEEVMALLKSPNPICRETSVLALKTLGHTTKHTTEIEKLLNDPNPQVRAFTSSVMGNPA